ncbi:protoporphyrinogen oxidase [Pirellulales bacterium]|nr:protoporphyrinogen oxidase [Pirellulales bacterium]
MANAPSPGDAVNRPQIAIIGGGISGLTAAYRIRQTRPDAELVIYEAGRRVGGALDTRHRDGFVSERGADSFITTIPAAVELCRELGLAEQLIPTAKEHRRAWVVCRGKLTPVPPGLALMAPHRLSAMLRSPILSWRGKLRLLMEPWKPVPADVHAPDYDESVADFAARRLGWETSARLVEPLIAGIYVADAARLSLAATQPKFLDAERIHGSLVRFARSTGEAADRQTAGARYNAFVSLRGGMSTLVDALVSQLPEGCIRLGTSAARISRVGNQSDSRWRVEVADDQPAEFDGLILAVPAPRAATLLADVDAELAAQLRQIHHASSAVATLVYHRESVGRSLDAFGFVVPAIERRKIIAASFANVKFPDRAPSDVAVIRVFLGGRLQPDLLKLSDDQLAMVAHDELADLLAMREGPIDHDVCRWTGAMPQYEVGHLQLVDDIEQRTCKHPGLQLVGNAYRGVGIPHCVAYANARMEQLRPWLETA